ncbi:sensor histidine kinase [Nocardiopsis coralliicola]
MQVEQWPDIGTDAAAAMQKRMRIAWWIMVFSLSFVALQIPFLTVATAVSGVAESIALWRVAVGVAVSVPLTAVVIWMLILRMQHRVRPVLDRALLGGSAALMAVEVVVFDMWTGTAMIVGAWWSSAWVLASRRWRVAITAVALAAPWARALFFTDPDWMLVGGVMLTGAGYGGVLLSGNIAMLWLWDVAKDSVAGWEARARLAVSEERLRFARDMHDLLGHSLSGIAVQSELAARLAERDAGRAAEEMRAVQQHARDALREVRSAVTGYRAIDLHQEIDTLTGVLAASGARTAVAGDVTAVPVGLRSLAGWVVREAVTNVIRHSTATRCEIALRRDATTATIEVYNDGASEAGAAPRGNGLTGLAERVSAAGGTLSASPSGSDGFLVRAVLPADEPAAAPRPGTAPAERGPEGALPAAPPEGPAAPAVQAHDVHR